MSAGPRLLGKCGARTSAIRNERRGPLIHFLCTRLLSLRMDQSPVEDAGGGGEGKVR